MAIARWVKTLGWGLGAGIVTLIGFCLLSPTLYTEQFIRESIAEMRRYNDPLQVPGVVYKRRFADGSAIAICMEHACCSGRGYNATVIYDSEGKVFVNTERIFCGYEELSYDMSAVPAKSLAEFYTGLRDMSLKPR